MATTNALSDVTSKIPILSSSKEYNDWALALRGRAMLISNVWPILMRTKEPLKKPKDDAKDKVVLAYETRLKKYEDAHLKAMGLILTTVDQNLQLLLGNLKVPGKIEAGDNQPPPKPEDMFDADAANMWDFLKEHFERKDGINAVIDLGNYTRLTLLDSEPMESQLAKHATQCARLAINGYPFDDHIVASFILLALPPSFESIKTHFLDGLEDPKTLNLNTVTARIIECDQRVRSEQSSANAITGPPKAGNKKKGKAKFKGKPKNKDKKEKPPGACWHCGKEGHWNSECKQKKKKPDQPGGSSSLHVVASEESTHSDAEITTLCCYLPSCEDWLMDSGATEHLTPYQTDFKSYEAHPESRAMYVTLGDSKTCLRVHGSGTVERWAEIPNNKDSHCQLTLTNVLHIPGIKRRFLSLSTFDDKGFELQIKNRRLTATKGNTSFVGTRVDKLYVTPMWQDRPSPQPNSQLHTAIAKPLPVKTWHKCMGHINWEALKTVWNSKDVRATLARS